MLDSIRELLNGLLDEMEPNSKQRKERTCPLPKGFVESLNIREIIARMTEEEKDNLKRKEVI